MKAVQYEQYGDPTVLHVVNDVSIPECGDHEIRIKVKAAGINPYDTKRRRGLFAKGKPLSHPIIPCVEASGIVDKVGKAVSGINVGDAVFGSTHGGGASEYAILRHWMKKPHHVSFNEAAAVPVSAQAALRALNELNLQPGQTLFVHGGSGGVGQAAIQMAIAKGLKVIADGSSQNHDIMESYGAKAVNYGEGLVARVKVFQPDGIIDTSGTQLDDLIAIVGDPHKIVTLANYSGPDKGVRIPGAPEDPTELMQEITRYLDNGQLHVRLTGIFTLEDAVAGHTFVETQHGGGRSVFIINEGL